jgi:hypothetical protein
MYKSSAFSHRFGFLLFLVLLNFACSPKDEAQTVVDKAIAYHGGKIFENVTISFDFRERHYQIHKSPNSFRYTREFQDSTGLVKDILDNYGFKRYINGEIVDVDPEKAKAYSNSVNSVAYFAFLPYGLNDPAVFKQYLGISELDGKRYHSIKVTFSENGGGEDFEDEFIYWFGEDDYALGFLAYSYHTEGGGVRLRKVIDVHEIEGLRLLDYDNYKPVDKKTPLESLEDLYREGQLELLSQILLEEIEVTKIN